VSQKAYQPVIPVQAGIYLEVSWKCSNRHSDWHIWS